MPSTLENLYVVARSFDKNEKRQLKMRLTAQTKSADDYARLFDEIAAFERWEEEACTLQLRKKWGSKLPQLARSLYGWLLRIIEDMHRDTPYQRFWHLLQQIDALFHRKAHEQAWQLIEELDEMAQAFQSGIMQLYAHNWRISYLRSALFNFRSLDSLDKVEDFLSKSEAILQNLRSQQDSDSHIFRLVYYYHKLPNDPQRAQLAKQLLQKISLPKEQLPQLSTPARFNYYMAQIFYYINQADYEQLLYWALEQWNFAVGLPNCYESYANMFYGNWTNIVLSAVYAAKWEVLEEFYEKLKALLPTMPRTLPFEQILDDTGEYARLIMYYKQGRKAELEAQTAVCERIVEKYPATLAPLRRAQFAYWLALLEAERGQGDAALQHLHAYTQGKKGGITFALEVAMHFLLLHLHRQRAAWRYLRYATRRCYRWYKQRAEMSRLERRFLRLMLRYAEQAPKPKIRRQIEKINALLLQAHPADADKATHLKELLFYCPLQNWLR